MQECESVHLMFIFLLSLSEKISPFALPWHRGGGVCWLCLEHRGFWFDWYLLCWFWPEIRQFRQRNINTTFRSFQDANRKESELKCVCRAGWDPFFPLWVLTRAGPRMHLSQWGPGGSLAWSSSWMRSSLFTLTRPASEVWRRMSLSLPVANTRWPLSDRMEGLENQRAILLL